MQRLVRLCIDVCRGTTVHQIVRRLGPVLPLVAVGLLLTGCAAGYTDPATGVTDTEATLNGSVGSSLDGPTTYWFFFGTTVFYGKETPHRTITITDRASHPVSETVSGLSPGITYHYVVCAQDSTSWPICGADQTFGTSQAAPTLSISTQPALFPAFDTAVSDYVTRCGASPVTMSVVAPPGTTVAVDGDPGQSGTFTRDVQLSPGRAFGFSTTTNSGTSTFNVRCLPPDFPAWTYSRPGVPAASFYIATPQAGRTPAGGAAGGYVAIFDRQGVPVWWKQAASSDAKLLPDGTLGWWAATSGGTSIPGFEIHRLDGSLVRTWRTVGADTDTHDFQLLPNGDALMLDYPPRPGTIDLSQYGGPSTNATVLDAEIQEISPDGHLVWSWNSKDHIPLSETGQRWWASVLPRVALLPDGRKAYDYAHINSIQEIGDTIVASIRHFDAVYGIDRSSGNIVYKLGGTPRPESLTVLDDPEGGYPLGGQHYARMLEDGTLTLHDNNSLLTDRPRAVRYRIDLSAGTAQLLEQVTDPDVAASPCCGSAERLGDGSWVMDWGGTDVITEFGPDGARHFELRFALPGFVYRVAVITSASPSIADLRAGMDAMTVEAQRTEPGPSFVLPEANVVPGVPTTG